jgi:ribosomal protein L11 methyltransferase
MTSQNLDNATPSSRAGPMQDTTIATLETDEQSARRVADLFAESFGDDVAVSLADCGEGTWRVTLYFHGAVDEHAMRDQAAIAGGAAVAGALRFETIAAKDWVAESLTGLKPVAAGRFIVHGAHDRSAVPPNRIGIEIEAALAFGTGHHGTTRGCLLALDRLCKTLAHGAPKISRHPEARAKGAPRRISARAVALRGSLCSHLRVTERRPRMLDLGTGTGVLAIAAACALHARVLASDIDAAAVRAAAANARLNRAGALVKVVKAAGVAAPAIRGHAPFDLVFANILLAPLRCLAGPLSNLVAPGGRIVLSGILTAQANAALAAYHAFHLERWIVIDGWTTLVLRRGR